MKSVAQIMSVMRTALPLALVALNPLTPARAQSAGLFTAAQAEQGAASYEHECRTCHGDHLDDGDFGGPPLNGSYFQQHWGAGSAAALYSFVKTMMPPDNAGGHDDETYADIVAFLLQSNGYRAGPKPFPTDSKAQAALSLKKE
jgi:cytochrome c